MCGNRRVKFNKGLASAGHLEYDYSQNGSVTVENLKEACGSLNKGTFEVPYITLTHMCFLLCLLLIILANIFAVNFSLFPFSYVFSYGFLCNPRETP